MQRIQNRFFDQFFHPWQLLSPLRYPSKLLDGLDGSGYHHRLLDRVIAAFTQNHFFFPPSRHGFFSHGWGNMNIIQDTEQYLARSIASIVRSRLSSGASIHTGYPDIPSISNIQWKPDKSGRRSQAGQVIDGTFEFANDAGNSWRKWLPKESHVCYVQLILPLCPSPNRNTQNLNDLVMLLPGTGEQGFQHRRNTIGLSLARRGIASVILEGPFYGQRSPESQVGTKLRHVTDLPLLGRATIEETRALMDYFQNQLGFQHIVLSGNSMGGLHAAMTASLTPFPVGVVSWMAPPSAVPAFISGLMSSTCNWTKLSSLRENHKHHCQEKKKKKKKKKQDHEEDQGQKQQQRVFHLIHELLGNNTRDQRKRTKSSTLENPTALAKENLSRVLSITDIRHFPAPVCPRACVIALAKQDEYIGPVEQQWHELISRPLDHHDDDTATYEWTGAQIRTYQAGHVSGILFEQHSRERAICDMLATLATLSE